jgi:hypothetical protein
VPTYLKPPPTTTHDGTIALKKRQRFSESRGSEKEGVQHQSAVVADEPINESKVWGSWDEDHWMTYCMLSTKAGRERYHAAKEECASKVRTWAQEVSAHRSAGL